jgi:predicted DNA binding CopG/RHH family protein
MEVYHMDTRLDSFEQNIEDSSQDFVPISTAKKQIIETIIDEAKKTKNINIRISSYDLEKLREKSAYEGLPYQTLISSILHKYVNNQLINEKDIIKSLQLLHTEKA